MKTNRPRILLCTWPRSRDILMWSVSSWTRERKLTPKIVYVLFLFACMLIIAVYTCTVYVLNIYIHLLLFNFCILIQNGQTPLCLAIEGKMTGAAQVLIDSGANLNINDRDGNGPLHFSCSVGCHDIVSYLIEKNVKIASKNKVTEESPLLPLLCLSLKKNVDLTFVTY